MRTIQRLILLSHHRAVHGTFRSLHSKLTPYYLFSRNRNGLLKSGKTGAAHVLVQVQSDGQFKPIYQCKLISEEHPQSSQQGSAPQMEAFALWLSLCEGMSPWSRNKQTGHLAQLQGTKMISNKKSAWLKKLEIANLHALPITRIRCHETFIWLLRENSMSHISTNFCSTMWSQNFLKSTK
jgi:hypothetical protein